jgi:hypothetical protein
LFAHDAVAILAAKTERRFTTLGFKDLTQNKLALTFGLTGGLVQGGGICQGKHTFTHTQNPIIARCKPGVNIIWSL